jgi:hypothetical protein
MLEVVSKSLKVDGLKVVLVNQSLARYELVPFRVNGVKVAAAILRGKIQMIIDELKEREDG